MNCSSDDAPGSPTEWDFALCAPHLIAAADFIDAFAARRTGFGVFLEKFDCFHGILVANMLFLFDFAALGANICFTHLAFPSSRQKPLTGGNRTGLREFFVNGYFFSISDFMLISPHLSIDIPY